MDRYLYRVNQTVTGYDRLLYAMRVNGVVQIWRQPYRATVEGVSLRGRPEPEFIVALTDDWSLSGRPVEWGMEPILEQFRRMDSWQHSVYDEIVEKRERRERNAKREQKNEFAARAADLRRDFAKATNEINTASLSKFDRRRLKEK